MKALVWPRGRTLAALARSMRPRQWIKNVFIFAPLVFDEKLLRPEPLGRTVAGFLILCLLSGAVYLFNDLQDLERDRQHPRKRNRPLAAGELDPRVAWGATLLIPLGLAYPALALDSLFALLAYVYWGLNLAYSLWLKHQVILDVLALASGYVLRVAAGVPLVQVERFSPWLYLCTLLLALFIGFAKRRQEIILLGENARNHRAILEEYTVRFLDEMMGVVMAAHHRGLFPLHVFRPQPSFQPRHDVDHPLRAVWDLPLSLSHSRPRGDRAAGRAGFERPPPSAHRDPLGGDGDPDPLPDVAGSEPGKR
jgi:4-hydroxybenzoate polyprenyltransferase